MRVHNFDPVFAPDGSVVFASTRAGSWTLYTALPNSNLYRVGPGLDFANPEQMTFLLNSEIAPAFMQDGRVTMTTEKVAPDNSTTGVFYQLAGRRMNWDLTDYHPLLAQRAQSTDTFTDDLQPSVDYQQATEIREGLDRNFLIILSDVGAKGGGGALATFNRSIGPFQADRTEVTFVRSVKIIDPAATGKAGTAGVYRSPFSLPNGEILASYDGAVTDPAAGTPQLRAGRGERRRRAPAACWPATAACRTWRRRWATSAREQLLFATCRSWCSAGTPRTAGDNAVMHFPDAPVLATLLGANLRQHRNVEGMDRAVALQVYEESPPPGSRMAAGTVYRQPHAARAGAVRGGPLAEGARAGPEAADPRVRRRRRQPGVHDDRGAPGGGGRVHHPGAAARAVQQHLRRLPRQPQRVGAGHRRQRGRADRRVGVDVAQPGAEESAIAHPQLRGAAGRQRAARCYGEMIGRKSAGNTSCG